ncbi:hypothetical protein ALC62_13694, partial [Cyphomyrmex costatus]
IRRIKNHTDLYHGHACFPKSEPINSADDLTWTELCVNDTNRYTKIHEGFSFDVTATGRDGRLTFSLRGTGYDNNRTSLCVPVNSSGSTDLGSIAYVYPSER